MSNIRISESRSAHVASQNVEYVERKGIGHPDSLIDGIVERASVELSKAYMDSTGMILHHNLDKGLIIGGASEASFGIGKITKPIEIILAGRAIKRYQDIDIPVDDIVLKAALDYLKEHTRFLDLENEVIFNSKILKGSSDLTGIFNRSTDVPLSNDTSFGIGFAPFTETEKLVMESEHFLNGNEYKQAHPYVGEDIKVMGVREENKITLTIAIAFVSKFVANADQYDDYKARIAEDVKAFAKKITSKEVEVIINNGDHRASGSFYLTKSGLSCESGDDGSVGRGNRVNGIITPFRHMSLEAAAGKNPVSHVGKIYSILANEIASDAVKLYPEIIECNVSIVSQIGRPINDPRNLDIKVILDGKGSISNIANKLTGLAEQSLENIGFLTREIVAGKYNMF
ncbi:MAG: methionine adenosyltransferase [Candidatus Marsarchaeota archaeon]|nr:methionine adenosyltransferase [Candidatus Marsarchaeota archaeon]